MKHKDCDGGLLLASNMKIKPGLAVEPINPLTGML